MPTPDEIADAAAITAEEGVQSFAADGQSVSAMDPMKQLDVADRLQARENAGASGSGFKLLRPARAIPPGAV